MPIMARTQAPAKEQPAFRTVLGWADQDKNVRNEAISRHQYRVGLFACRNKPDIQPRARAMKADLRHRPGIRHARCSRTKMETGTSPDRGGSV
jgi:hypothetical protein